jgi:hypothetical protein
LEDDKLVAAVMQRPAKISPTGGQSWKSSGKDATTCPLRTCGRPYSVIDRLFGRFAGTLKDKQASYAGNGTSTCGSANLYSFNHQEKTDEHQYER